MIAEAGPGQVDDGVVALEGGGVDGALGGIPSGFARARDAANEAGDGVAVFGGGRDQGAADQPVRAGDDDLQAAATCRERSITWSMMP